MKRSRGWHVLELSMREARRLTLGAQLLAGPTPKRPTKARMLETIRHLGALQIDSISVVARSHHIVMWSRIGNHPTDWLYDLLEKDRAIFEYWAHAAAYVPIELFPYFRRIMLNFDHETGDGWGEGTVQWIRENQDLIDHVVNHIRENGPVSTKSFAPPEGAEKASPWAWYGNKPTNRILEFLWTNGTLMIDRREKFQRWYDLREQVHPEWSDDMLPSEEEQRLALSDAATRAMGVTTRRWLPDYFRTWGSRAITGAMTQRILDDLVERGALTPARIKGLDDQAYVRTELLERRIPMSRTTLLSPFDNLVWHRMRTAGLFDFELFLEAYTPAEKRRWGYFSLPILYRDQLVGRLDPKADRKARHFTVRALHLEDWFVPKADERFYASLANTLWDFAAFNACDTISIERSDPEYAAVALRNALTHTSPAPDIIQA
jgi:uncharacterized protein YcaQ